ncbi:MAG TPA: isoprenylcysteine carboxylmethyltransferase family protein [Ignavibacteria bacterium]|nr:isoprenylcysteine carboxylmethyltransferase family protein [Ignavibacteria bacterium]
MLVFINPTFLSIIIGFVIALCGEAIRIWAVSYAGSETRTTSGVGGTYLVTQGPYSITRNPLYIGNILIYTGIGVMSKALFPYLQIAGLIFFTFQYYCIILNEEEYLQKTFRDKFHIYTVTVNRFFPKFKLLPEEIKSDLPLDVAAGLKSERRSLQAFLILSSIIIIYFLFKTFSS